MPEWKNKSTSELTESLDSLGATYEVIGDGNKIMDVSVNAGEQITPIQKKYLLLQINLKYQILQVGQEEKF